MVRESDQKKQCPGFGAGSFYLERSQKDRALAQTLGRDEHAPERDAVSVGDVYAQLLYQPRGEGPAGRPQTYAQPRQGGTAKAFSLE